MKKRLILSLIALATGVLSTTKMFAQVYITQFYGWPVTSCSVPVNVGFGVYGQTSGYTVNDSVTATIDYGDGNTFSFKEPIQSGGSFYTDSSFVNPNHTYTIAGIYTAICVVTGPDGAADTAVQQIIASDGCENVSGKMYVDENDNCTYDAGEPVMSGITFLLKDGSNVISSTITNSSGDYSFTVPTAVNGLYDVAPSDTSYYFSYYGYHLACPVSGQYTGVSVPSSALDFGLKNAYPSSISVNNFSGYPNTACSAPVSVWFGGTGNVTGCNPNDIVTVDFYYGDGSTMSYTTSLFNFNSGTYYFWLDSLEHTYTFPGVFTPAVVVTGPDGQTDTVYSTIVITDTCGNVSGKMYIDANSNCLYDAGEQVLAGIPIQLKQGGNVVDYSYTNTTGDYYFSVSLSGTFDVVPFYTGSYGYTITCPVSGQYTGVSGNTSGLDFGLNCASGFDLQTYVDGWDFNPGFDGEVFPEADNFYCQSMDGQLELILDSKTTFVDAYPAADYVNGDTVRWNISNMSNSNYWWNWNAFSFWPYVTVHTDSTAAIGDSVCFTTIVTPTSGDINTANNTYYACFPVENAWDPNRISVSPRGTGPSGLISQGVHTMTYTVEFQNTGNATAHNIFVLDTIDSNLDISTFQAVAADHNMTVNILSGNVIKFSFDNIMLVDSSTDEKLSHGRFTYRINTKANLQPGTQIKGKAGIYFDYNPEVMTNTVLNTIFNTESVREANETESMLSITPNPVTNSAVIAYSLKTSAEVNIALFDVLGNKVKQLEQSHQLAGVHQVNFNNELSAGVYFLKMETEGKTISKKLMMIH